MYDVSVQVTPRLTEPSERIVIEWPGYKALLEHGVRLNLTADAHPKGLVQTRR